MKKIHSAQSKIEAFLLTSLLESHGIPAKVSGKQALNIRLSALPPKVYILRDEDFDRAKEIISEFCLNTNVKHIERGDHWQCSECGEFHGSQFKSCWKCENSRVDQI